MLNELGHIDTLFQMDGWHIYLLCSVTICAEEIYTVSRVHSKYVPDDAFFLLSTLKLECIEDGQKCPA